MTAKLTYLVLLASKGPEIQDAYHYAMAATGDDESLSTVPHPEWSSADYFSNAIKTAKEAGIKLPNARVLGAAWVASEIKRQAKEAGIDARSSEKFRPCSTCGANVCLSFHETNWSRDRIPAERTYRCSACQKLRDKEAPIRELTALSDAEHAEASAHCKEQGIDPSTAGEKLYYAAAAIHGRAMVLAKDKGTYPAIFVPEILAAAFYVAALDVFVPEEITEGTEKVLRVYTALADQFEHNGPHCKTCDDPNCPD